MADWFNDFYGPSYDVASYNWPSNSWPEELPSGWGLELLNGETNWQGTVPPLALSVQEHCDADFTMDYSFGPHETFHRVTQTKLSLATGGEAGSTNVNLWRVAANATAQTLVAGGGTFPDDPPVNSATGSIPFTNISAGVFGQLDADGQPGVAWEFFTLTSRFAFGHGGDHPSYVSGIFSQKSADARHETATKSGLRCLTLPA